LNVDCFFFSLPNNKRRNSRNWRGAPVGLCIFDRRKKNWTKSTSFKVVVDSVEGEVGMGERADAAQREDQENQTNLKEGKGKPESSHSTR
jgi:hypothetical protein